jgi:transcriptional regulator with XRE-family HTH domain
MQQVLPARVPTYGIGFLMPAPGRLGRLIRRRRAELGMTQPELETLTEKLGCKVPQNLISRIESGKSQRINDVDRLAALGKALGFDSHEAFILAAYGPAEIKVSSGRFDPDIEILPPGAEGEIIKLVRPKREDEKQLALRVLRGLFADEAKPS